MPTLTECMEDIRKLVKEKGHEDTIEKFNTKLLFAFVELGEATDIWKKHGLALPEEIAEELIDAIFYILDAYGLLCRELNVETPDKMFLKKLEKNMNRKHKYGRPKK